LFKSKFYQQLDDCEWESCVDPPTPQGYQIKHDFDGVTPYELFSNATYTCERDGLYFEEDKNMVDFTIECQEGGRWKTPLIWPKCVESK
jgi:hypothetical protein